jgi:hypothetical protein
MADNLTIFMCQLSRNLGTSTSWNPLDLSRPVQGQLYLLRHILAKGVTCLICKLMVPDSILGFHTSCSEIISSFGICEKYIDFISSHFSLYQVVMHPY